MSFDEGDTVVLEDKHSEHDGERGTITQVMETMFGDQTYTISFEDGQEAGVPADQLEPAPADADEADDEEGVADDDAGASADEAEPGDE